VYCRCIAKKHNTKHCPYERIAIFHPSYFDTNIFLFQLGFGGSDIGTSSASQTSRVKFGGLSFRNQGHSDMYTTSQL